MDRKLPSKLDFSTARAAAVRRRLLGATFIAFCASASAQVVLPCAYDDKRCAAKAVKDHPAWSVKYWKEHLAKPLEQRIGTAPPELVEFLHLGVILGESSYRPRAALADPEFLQDVRDAVAELPQVLKNHLATKLAGIFLVDDFWCCGWSDQIFDENRKPVAGMVALTRSLLRAHTANSWATWKENTPFAAHPAFRLTMRIAREGENDRRNAIQYVLLHELGHVFAIGANVHPSWNLAPAGVRSTAQFPYFLLSWRISREENRYVTLFDENVFPQRKDIAYFRAPRLSADQAVAVYENLERTNLPTLYAAASPAEDFAEAFVTYVHTVLMKKPFRIEIHRDGALAKAYAACWEEPRCAEKRKILERMLNGGT